jgi:tetratricopeptide (TPR) repeat protein
MRRLFRWLGLGKRHVQPTVSAHSGAVAAGRDIRDAIINIGVDEKGVSRALEHKQLEEAIAGYRARLTALAQELAPAGQSRVLDVVARRNTPELREALARASTAIKRIEWAGTQTNLGVALLQLASGSAEERALLEKAVAAFREALKVLNPGTQPWAFSQTQLAIALARLGPERRDEAVAAFRAALTVWILDNAPIQWANTQGQLGNALLQSSDLSETARLQEAVAAFHEALKVWTQQSAPSQWAVTQYTLGFALEVLGQDLDETARLEEAAAAYRAALEEIPDPDTRKMINDGLVRSIGLLKQRRNQRCGGDTLRTGG